MQMGYDFEDPRQRAGLPQRIARFAGENGLYAGDADAGFVPASPDWAGLRARFAAIHALHRTLEEGRGADLPVGGFLEAGELVLATCRESAGGVNPFCSANGKAAQAMIQPVAASPTSGDRGMQ